MELALEISLVLFLSVLQSVFGVGLLLFGTPTFLLLGNDFQSTLTLLLPISITISLLQISCAKTSIKPFAAEYNIFCLPFLILFLWIALSYSNDLDIKIYVAFFLILSSVIILNRERFTKINKILLKNRRFCLVFIGSVHGFTNMSGGFLSIFSSLVNNNDRDATRNYISYGYLVMGIVQYSLILFIDSESVDFTKLYYLFIPLVFYFPAQKLFNNIEGHAFTKMINVFAITYGVFILVLSFR
ncbi:MAG: hypothetical protein CMM52_03985 [Rhodospirillaceae bacterium]|nr:hypothetical protein [Rhodospirillaceae bacterium]|tara:strand:+ start:2927 stop:3655 length:729 start_codon:yes stop_codon:yes gene_type:complete